MKKLFIPFIIFLTSCSSISKEYEATEEVCYNYAEKMYKKYGLCFMTHFFLKNLGPNQIDLLNTSFLIKKQPSLEEARQLLLPCIDEFVDEINNSPNLKSHFKTYPCTSKEVSIGIGFVDDKGEHTPEGIAHIFLTNNTIIYSVYKDNDLVNCYRESLEEAKSYIK